ncbi:MAG: DUF559 domain-containing protein, partial [Alphaproteobacteria bacterium]
MSVERARRLRRQSTGLEGQLWHLLRHRRLGGLKFRRQVTLGRYIVDFACFKSRLVIEADGKQHLGSLSDKARDAWLSGQGFTVLRFWNHEISDRPDWVLDEILRVAK